MAAGTVERNAREGRSERERKEWVKRDVDNVEGRKNVFFGKERH